MAKRFTLLLDDSLHEDFSRLFPDYGARSLLVRRFIRRVVERAKKQNPLEREVCEVLDLIWPPPNRRS